MMLPVTVVAPAARVPVVDTACAPKSGLIFVPWIAAVALTSASAMVPSKIFAEVTAPSCISLVWIASLPRVTVPVAVRSVTLAAAAVVPPMIVLSIVPALISAVLVIKPPAAVISKAWVPEIMTFPCVTLVTRSGSLT